MAITTVVPSIGDVTDPVVIEQIAADLTDLDDRLSDVETLTAKIGRVGTTLRTSAVGTFTAETITDTVTFSQVSGRTYGIFWFSQTQSSVGADQVGIKIREDNVSGTILTNQRAPTLTTSGVAYPVAQYAEYTAGSTGSKTIVGTQVRSSGTGNITAGASANQQAVIFVFYVSG